MTNTDSILVCNKLTKTYQEGPAAIDVLNGIDLSVKQGEKIAIIGASGSGKTTLLNMLGGLDLATDGNILIDGVDIAQLSEKERGQLRNKTLGFVYQFHHLLGEFTALENVCIPLLIGNTSIKEIEKQGRDLLRQVGLEHRLTHKPAELSGGERQRVAIARALVTQPKCVLMDEPTGNLDQETADKIHDLILQLNQESNTCFIVVTHNLQLANKMDRVFTLEQGLLNQQLNMSQ